MSELKFKTVKQVTLPALKIENDTAYHLRVDSAIYQVKSNDKTKKDGGADARSETMDAVHVTDLHTGEMHQLLVPYVLKSELESHYPGEKYVGKCFLVKKFKDADKRYFTFEIAEIEIEKTPAGKK